MCLSFSFSLSSRLSVECLSEEAGGRRFRVASGGFLLCLLYVDGSGHVEGRREVGVMSVDGGCTAETRGRADDGSLH